MKKHDFGQKLIQVRQAKGWTQMNLAEKSNISLRTIQRIECGQVNPRAYTINRLSEIIGLNFYEKIEITGINSSKIHHSDFKWSKIILWHFSNLFNLKTNAMRKLSILTILFCTIVFGLFCITTKSVAQDATKQNNSMFIETNGRGIIYLFPRGKKTTISNVKDTAELIVGKNIIREIENKVYLNGEFVGYAQVGDTVILNKNKLIIKQLLFWEYCQTGTKGVKYYIPRTFKIENFSYNGDTVKIDFNRNHIMQYQDQVFLNDNFIGYVQKGDKVTYLNNKLEIQNN